ncbi:uncharacterized protein LOC117475643 isoform X2 [Trematomus bernacchii]|uniref:uncharacterized protein LOC117475643 isoform X2 n=1 Tax=Trematomus bernacchii TaxID=40690 RepID=UPI00146E7DAC|nr:uncharacterized protein LOC117475643 isoform X2 [Trematomus bernacchii]
MEYLTMVVRWANPPLEHINFVSESLIHWHLGRWKLEHHTRPDITVLCAQVASVHFAECSARMLDTLKHLWVDVDSNVMQKEELSKMLGASNVFPYRNLYSVTHTDIQPGLSFLDHLAEAGKALSVRGWEQLKSLCVSDPSTSFKIQCKHEPHSVAVLLPGSRNLMITVRCSEPQRIHELMKKYGVTCSGVFDSTVCVSARSPCTALCDYKMTVVHVTIIPSDDPFCDEPDLSNFYHNMRHVQIRARRSTLRHKPYPSQQLIGDLDDIRRKGIRIALYYNGHRTDLIRVIKEDGRFLDDVQCDDPGTGQWARCTQQLRPESELTLRTGASRDSDDSDIFAEETAPIDQEDSDVTVDSEEETAPTRASEDTERVGPGTELTVCKNTNGASTQQR